MDALIERPLAPSLGGGLKHGRIFGKSDLLVLVRKINQVG